MTGLECLRAELRKRGFQKGQTESKVVSGVLDILSETGDMYKDQDKLIEERNALLSEISYLKTWKTRFDYEIKIKEEAIESRRKEAREYIEAWYKAIEDCETPEGKDIMRTAQMFVNTVTVDSKYDNTAFIIGLAGILSGNKVAPMLELKKINKKLFDSREKEDWI